jgi:hypothetical protein
VTAEFDCENPDDIQEEILEVAARCQHLKLMAANASRFKFCDFNKSKEVAAIWSDESLARHEKPANFLNNAAKAHKWDDLRCHSFPWPRWGQR